VFETSAEWPHLAAIERERRQRAALAFEQSLRGRSLALIRQNSRGGGRQYQLHAPQQSRQPGRLHASDEGLVAECCRPGPDDRHGIIRHRSDPSRRSATVDASTDGELPFHYHVPRDVKASRPKFWPQPRPCNLWARPRPGPFGLGLKLLASTSKFNSI